MRGSVGAGSGLNSAGIWQAEIEHHFALIAGRNLFRALELAPTTIAADATMRVEIIEGRDLDSGRVGSMTTAAL